jgi:cytochrome c oxidase assembly protein subunit 15
MVAEALLGAALVLKGLVGENATIFRLVIMTLHQMNSLLLTGSTVIFATVTDPRNSPLNLTLSWKKLFSSGKNGIIFMMIPATGAWAALANTLFPSQNLEEGFKKDLNFDTPWILKLRIIHPLLALSLGFYLVFIFFKKSEATEGKTSQSALLVAGAFSIALIFGTLTLLFLSPVWMKLVHLTLAQLVWISLVNYVMISLLSTRR